MRALAIANLTIRFLVELLALGIVGHWAFTRGADGVTGVLFAIVAMLVAVVIWGLFLAPRSRLLRRLSRERKDFLATLVLLAAALLLASAGHSSLAVIYAVAVVVNAALLFLVRGESEQFLKDLGPGPRRQRR